MSSTSEGFTTLTDAESDAYMRQEETVLTALRKQGGEFAKLLGNFSPGGVRQDHLHKAIKMAAVEAFTTDQLISMVATLLMKDLGW